MGAVAAVAVAAAAAEVQNGLDGIGIGWRPEISGVVGDLPGLGFCEVIAESLDPSAPPRAVTELRERGVTVVPHGVRLSLGSAAPVDRARVTHLAACAAAVGAPLASEHIAFVRAGGQEAGHLLPVPRSRAALNALAANIGRIQAELDVPLALEPIAALFDWPDDEYTEADFLTALLDRTGALLLLDVANVHANARNRGTDPVAALDALPLDRIAYVHIAGGAVIDGLYHDTHTHAVPEAVLDLLTAVRDRLPASPPVMLERDGRYPPAATLRAEFDAIASASRGVRARESGSECARIGGWECASRGMPNAGSGSTTAPTAFATVTATTAPAVASPLSASRTAAGRVAPVDVRGAQHPGPRHPGSAEPAHASSAGSRLSADQAGLIATLVAGAPEPAGFDGRRLDATRRALLRKRAGEVATVWPLLAASLRPDWPRMFVEHAAGHPPLGALRDGWDLARALRSRGLLPGGAVGELAERDADMRYDGTGAPRPRGRIARHLRRLRRRAAPARASRR